MARHGTRTTLAPAVYKDAAGYEARVAGGRGKGNTRRFQLGPLQSERALIAEMQRWQRERRTTLATTAPPAPPSQAHTLKADVPIFLALYPKDSQKRKDFDILLAAWLQTPLALLRRDAITVQHVKRQLATWATAGYAISTRNHRLRALRTLYAELDGAKAPNPARIPKTPELDPEPRGVHPTVALAILDAMPLVGPPGAKRRSDTWIRLSCIFWMGIPHIQLMRLRRQYVNFETAQYYAQPRRKGKGTKGTWLPLLPQALEALRAYDVAGLWETTFSRDAMRRSFRVAIRRAQEHRARTASPLGPLDIPDDLRPYDLRHSFGTHVFRVTGNQRAVQELLQHADIRTTRRYMEGAVSEVTAAAIRAVAQSLPGSTKVHQGMQTEGKFQGKRGTSAPPPPLVTKARATRK